MVLKTRGDKLGNPFYGLGGGFYKNRQLKKILIHFCYNSFFMLLLLHRPQKQWEHSAIRPDTSRMVLFKIYFRMGATTAEGWLFGK